MGEGRRAYLAVDVQLLQDDGDDGRREVVGPAVEVGVLLVSGVRRRERRYPRRLPFTRRRMDMAHFLQCHSGSWLSSVEGMSGLKLSCEMGAISSTTCVSEARRADLAELHPGGEAVDVDEGDVFGDEVEAGVVHLQDQLQRVQRLVVHGRRLR